MRRITDYSLEIAQILASGGYVSRGRGGYSAHYERMDERMEFPDGMRSRCYSHMSGCGSELWDQAVAAGVPCHDTTTIPDELIYEVVSFPIPEPATFDRLEHRASDPDWSGACSVSYCDARLYAVLAWTLGATLAGQPVPSEEEQRKAAGWFAARDARRAAYAAERAARSAPQVDDSDPDVAELRASVLDLDDPDGLVQLHPPRAAGAAPVSYGDDPCDADPSEEGFDSGYYP